MIELQSLGKIFYKDKSNLEVVSNISLAFRAHSFTALIGPSGCGKSTLLNMIAGLYQPSSGDILYNGKQILGANTDVGYMTQKDNLLPWRTILDNVALPLEIAGVPKKQRHEQARSILQQVDLSGFENKYSSELSGGMRKRVALAQTLINEPRLLLLDEPFSALDVQTRAIMTEELMQLWDQTGSTVMFVTHDLEEAIALSDRVLVLTAGPGSIKANFKIDLPRPRKARDIRFSPEFIKIYQEIWEVLREEVDVAYQRQLIASK